MQLPATITSKITDFFGVEIKLHAVYWIGTIQLALWAAGPLSGYGMSINSTRSPTPRFPHLKFSVHRSDAKREQTETADHAIIDGEILRSPPLVGISERRRPAGLEP